MNFFDLFHKETVAAPQPEQQSSTTQTDGLARVHFKRGDFVRVVRVPDSPLNIWKGYNGEIKDYVKGTEHAMVVLEALNAHSPIRFPINHLIKRTD